MQTTLAVPATPQPVGRLALALTGYVITGADGVVFDGVTWPRPPWTLTDAAGAVIPLPHDHLPNWAVERIAVRTWRQRAEATDYCLTREAVEAQLRLKVEIAALEAEVAARRARIVAIDVMHGNDEVGSLDAALEAYGREVEAFESAQRAWSGYDVAEAA